VVVVALDEEDLARASSHRGRVSDATRATAAWNASEAMLLRAPSPLGVNKNPPSLPSSSTNTEKVFNHRPGCHSVRRASRTHAEVYSPSMGDIPPSPTIYVNNLNEKTKKDGASHRARPPSPITFPSAEGSRD
tara:strand:- start:249 stop:647 length:399 start_codon:yes stop_codon:yes gene_type:complete